MRRLAVDIQKLLPQPHVARAFGRLARSERVWLSGFLIRLWSRAFSVSLDDARRRSPDDYRSFEDFFTRELRAGARPQPGDPRALSSPADGRLQHFGPVDGGTLLQAKGIDYPLGSLLGDHALAATFEDGWYATIYLTPGDYHRLHMPCDATLRGFIAIPGQAYSVTEDTRQLLPDLYCRNERLVSLFETRFGPMVLVMVGAMLVTGIETVWRSRCPIDRIEKKTVTRHLKRGEEFGRFTLGSTVILALPAGALQAERTLSRGQRIRVGQPLGTGL